MQAVSLLNTSQKYGTQYEKSHAASFGGSSHVDVEARNARILEHIREKEETAQRGSAFYNAMQSDVYQKARNLSELNDEQMKTLSKAIASRDDKHKLNTYTAALVGIPVLDTIAKTVYTPGNLSGKISTAGKTAGMWGGTFILATLYNSLTNKISAVSPVARKFGDDHPVLASLLNLAGFGGVLVGAKKGLDLLISKSGLVFPKLAEYVRDFSAGTALKVNQSKINQKVLTPVAEQISKTASKFPKTSTVLKSALGLGAFAWAIGLTFKAIADRAESKNKAQSVYEGLKNARQQNINTLANVLKADAINEKIKEREINAARNEIQQAQFLQAVKEAVNLALAEKASAVDDNVIEPEIVDNDDAQYESGSRFDAQV